MTRHSQGANYSPLLKGQQHSALESQLGPERGAPSKQRALFLLTQMCALRTPDPTSHIRNLNNPDFKKTAAATYQMPLELRNATQRQQQQSISYIHDPWLHSADLDTCWGSGARANSVVLNYSARPVKVKVWIFLPHCCFFCLPCSRRLSSLQCLLNEEEKCVSEGVHTWEHLEKY